LPGGKSIKGEQMAEADNPFTASIAEVYDRHLGPALFEPYAMDLARRIAHCPPGPVLETACGTGILTRQLRLSLHPSVRIFATDASQAMLDYAQTCLGTNAAIQWGRADAAALPFRSGSFAVVACQFGMMFVQDKESAFREARRVLAEGGFLAFNVWDSLAQNPCCRIAHETVCSFFPENPPDFFRVAFGFHDHHELRRSLLAYGFDDVRLDAVELEVRCPSAGLLAVGQIKGAPVGIAIRQRGIAVDHVVDAVADALARLGGDRPFRSTMQALVVTARKARY
jgi:ubiquinone/menaquinone biosynthesis C-methylase UbiE